MSRAGLTFAHAALPCALHAKLGAPRAEIVVELLSDYFWLQRDDPAAAAKMEPAIATFLALRKTDPHRAGTVLADALLGLFPTPEPARHRWQDRADING